MLAAEFQSLALPEKIFSLSAKSTRVTMAMHRQWLLWMPALKGHCPSFILYSLTSHSNLPSFLHQLLIHSLSVDGQLIACLWIIVNWLPRLQMSYVDLFLIHSPYGGLNVDTYQALLDLKAKGIIRSVWMHCLSVCLSLSVSVSVSVGLNPSWTHFMFFNF